MGNQISLFVYRVILLSTSFIHSFIHVEISASNHSATTGLVLHFKKSHPGVELPEELRQKHRCPVTGCTFASKKEINLKMHLKKLHRDLVHKEGSPWYLGKVNIQICDSLQIASLD